MIPTEVLTVSPDKPDRTLIARAAGVLARGGLVAFPTETVYGLGADALNPEAVARVFAAKGRPSDNPLIVHIGDAAEMDVLGTNISPTARLLARSFWPGPLTLVVEAQKSVPAIVTAGLDTVALRIPDHAVARQLIGALGRGIVGPSANRSGRPSPTTARHVADDLAGRIDMILDAGPTRIGVESTVVDVTQEPPAILRLGGLTVEQIELVAGPVETSAGAESLRRSPGTRHRHYAPRAQVVLFDEGNVAEFLDLMKTYGTLQVGSIIHSETLQGIRTGEVREVLPDFSEGYSRGIFAALRALDERGVQVILVETVPESGIGRAIMERLRRAAEP